jgi:hypothetical protein
MATKIQLRRDTAANWETTNPVLSQGEIAYVLDSGRIKIGDGLTAWKDLALEGDSFKITSDNSRYGYHTVTGVKEFTFTPRGHRWVELVATASTTDGTFTVDATVYPDIAIVYDSYYNYGYNNRVVFNGDYSQQYNHNITGISINGNIYTITVQNTPAINSGDRITIISWVHGTTATWDGVYQSTDWRATQPTSNSNVVTIDISDDVLKSKLLANPTKSSIVFDDKPVHWIQEDNSRRLIDDARSIETIINTTGNTCQITFDGPPISIRTDDDNFTIVANASVNTSGLTYVAVSRTLYPQLNEYVYYSGGQITVNGQTINISSKPDAYQSTYEYNDLSYYGDNWFIPLNSAVTTCNTGDTITINWYKPGTEITLEAYDPGVTSYTNEIQWFDWNKDLPFFKASRTNGVMSGRIDWVAKITRPYENTVDVQNSLKPSYYIGEDYNNNSIYGTSTVTFDNINYDYHRYFGNTHNGDNTNNSDLFYSWGPDGIFFREYPYGNRSGDIKVKIAYKMDLFIGDDDEYWD